MRYSWLVLLFLPLAIKADPVKIEPVAFTQEVNAAKYALRLAYSCSNNIKECGGIIFKRDNVIYVTTPIEGTSFGVDIGRYWEKDGLNSRYKIIADYHVHICNKHNVDFANYFSSADAYANQGLHTVGYMLSICDMGIRVYDPNYDPRDDIEVDFKSGKKIYLTQGRLVDWALDLTPFKHLPKPRITVEEDSPQESRE